jgi:predicted RNA-binding Zn-ribbon protein involved in translation (DUF1610 family)
MAGNKSIFGGEKTVKKHSEKEGVATAPFNEAQVDSLNAYQQSGVGHPYTCTCGNHISMTATKDGLVCPVCGRVQIRVHAFTADGSWKILEECPFCEGKGLKRWKHRESTHHSSGSETRCPRCGGTGRDFNGRI